MAEQFAAVEGLESDHDRPRRRIPTPVWVLLVALALVGGYVAHDYVDLRQVVGFGPLEGAVSLTAGQLDRPVATYTLGDETYEVTARDAILQGSSLEGAQNDDGSYVMPSAEDALSAARTAILMREVEERGITVSDEEFAAYVEATFGTADVASLAETYGMDEQTVRERLGESAAIAALREQVVTAEPADALEEPAAPQDDNADETNADYAAYIIELAGDEWDSEANGWAREDGAFATALKDFDVRNDAASYDAARAAYYVAVEQRGELADAAEREWSAYVNDLLSEAQMTLSSLVL